VEPGHGRVTRQRGQGRRARGSGTVVRGLRPENVGQIREKGNGPGQKQCRAAVAN
jgi:hypothetical protein